MYEQAELMWKMKLAKISIIDKDCRIIKQGMNRVTATKFARENKEPMTVINSAGEILYENEAQEALNNY